MQKAPKYGAFCLLAFGLLGVHSAAAIAAGTAGGSAGLILFFLRRTAENAVVICGGRTVFFLLGEVIENGETEKIFSVPQDKRTEDSITGRFG